MRRTGPMSPLERIALGAIGAAVGAGGMAGVAYAGAILRWELAFLDRLAQLLG